MIAEELINQMIPPLKPADTLDKAIRWMEEMRIAQLPVIDKDQYIGLLSEDIIYEKNDESTYVSDVQLIGSSVYVMYNQHFYDILRLASSYAVQLVAVLGEEGNFLGVVTLHDTLNAFADSFSNQESGGILVMLIDYRDYSLAEISRLVESNQARILNVSVVHDTGNPNNLQVTLKINKTNLSRIVATFERFNYQIIAKFQPSEFQDMDKERLDLLFKYMDI
ncbi:MAG: CBS domain-containing protein [Microscillaceae bacterium]|nr:CBS domain-containing protein [Microscillaceae bacterium]